MCVPVLEGNTHVRVADEGLPIDTLGVVGRRIYALDRKGNLIVFEGFRRVARDPIKASSPIVVGRTLAAACADGVWVRRVPTR